MDSEEAVTSDRLDQLGVRSPRLKPITEMTVEKVFRIAEGLALYKEEHPKLMNIPSIIIWDSVANTQTEAGLVATDPNSVIGQKARLISHYLPKAISSLKQHNICMIAVNQLRDKLAMGQFAPAPDLKFLADKSIPGGKAQLFNCSHLAFIKAGANLKDVYGFSAIKVTARMVKNRLFTPNIDFNMVFSFERGFSNFWTNYELLKATKKISASAWCSLKSCPGTKFRQKDVMSVYKDNKLFRENWDRDVKESLQTEYVDKFNSTSEDLTDLYF